MKGIYTMSTTFSTIEDLTISNKAAEALAEARSTTAAELSAATIGVDEAQEKVEGLIDAAEDGEKVSATTLANANAAVTIAEARLYGAKKASGIVGRRKLVTDLQFIKGVSSAIEGHVFKGAALPVVVNLGKPPRAIPEGYTAPLLVISQEEDAEFNRGVSLNTLAGKVQATYFRSDLHVPLTADMLNKDVDDSVALGLKVGHVRSTTGMDSVEIKCQIRPTVALVTGVLETGQVLPGGRLGEDLYRLLPSYGGADMSGYYQQSRRVVEINRRNSRYDDIDPHTQITKVSTDADGVRTVEATIVQGWHIEAQEAASQRPGRLFPSDVSSSADSLVGAVDGTIGEVTAVRGVNVTNATGASNLYKVTLRVSAVGATI